MTQSRVPFIFTIDVHGRQNLVEEIDACLNQLDHADIRATFFVPAILATGIALTPVLRRLLREGHQLACHGLLHRVPEDFVRDPLEVQIATLTRAKTLLEDASASEITAFRAPSFLISANTLLALQACGFKADVSVNSRRLPLLSSQVGNLHWLLAPGRPYHPSRTNPYRRGELAMWEIPVSAFVLPFISTLYQAIGLRFAQVFAAVLLREARLRKKPVVYMAHPEEFYPSRHVRSRTYHFGADARVGRMAWRLFLPAKNAGFRFRWLLYERDEYRIHEDSLKMTRFLASQPDLEFLTVDQCLAGLNGAERRTQCSNGAPAVQTSGNR